VPVPHVQEIALNQTAKQPGYVATFAWSELSPYFSIMTC
jgi:hypothetical protein